MPEMKDSGVEWIGEIPLDWGTSKMRYIGQYINGYAFKPDDWSSEGKRIIRIQDLTGTNNNPNYYAGQLPDKYNVTAGDILVSWAATLDAFIWNNEDAWLNQHIFKAICFPKVMDKNFFFWVLKEAMENMNNDNKHGIVMQHITLSVFSNFTIPLPPKLVQRRIANYLDRKCRQIDAIIAKQQQIIEKLKEYKLSVITEAVTKGLDPNVPMKDSEVEWIGMVPEEWRISRIKYICEFNPGTKKANHDVVSYAPMECVKDGYLIKKEIRHDGISTGLTSFEEGDIIMAKVTPCFENGNIAIAKDLVNKFGVGSSELFVFRAKKVNTQWLFYFLRNSIFKKLAEATMTGTGGLKRVSPSFIRDFSLALPPEKEQRRIIEYLDKKCMEIDRVIKYKQSAVEKLGQYKKSLIYEVVTGKMEV